MYTGAYFVIAFDDKNWKYTKISVYVRWLDKLCLQHRTLKRF